MDIEIEDNLHFGYIRIFRSVQKKAWYKRSEYVHLWYHLLLSANHKDTEIMFSGKVIKLKKGEFVTSRKSLSEKTGIDENKVERILKLFKTEQQIEQRTDHQKRIILIKNWNLYQITKNNEQGNEQRVNNDRTTSEQRVNTDNNDKELNNDNKIKKAASEKFVKTETSVPLEMFVVWQNKNPDYPSDQEKDLGALYEISVFIKNQLQSEKQKVNGIPNQKITNSEIIEKWEKIIPKVLGDSFWKTKPLTSVKTNIQKFWMEHKSPKQTPHLRQL